MIDIPEMEQCREDRRQLRMQRDILAAALRHIVDDRSGSDWVYEAAWEEIRQMAKTALCEAGMAEKEDYDVR